jgi:hypothetical protein
MPFYRVTFSPSQNREPEIFEGGRCTVESSNSQIVTRRDVPFLNGTREIVVRRFMAHEIDGVEEISDPGNTDL